MHEKKRVRWDKNEYIDIKTGEILEWAEIKKRGLILKVVNEEEKCKTIKNPNNNECTEWRQCIKYVEIRAEQRELWN